MGHEPRLQHVTILAVEGCELLSTVLRVLKRSVIPGSDMMKKSLCHHKLSINRDRIFMLHIFPKHGIVSTKSTD